MTTNRVFAIRAAALRVENEAAAAQAPASVSSTTGVADQGSASSDSVKFIINRVMSATHSFTQSDGNYRPASVKTESGNEVNEEERVSGNANEGSTAGPTADDFETEAQMHPVFTNYAMTPDGRYSQAVIVPQDNHLIFTSGQGPALPTGQVLSPDTPIAVQTALCFAALANVLRASHSSLEKIVKLTVFLADIDDIPEFEDTYNRFILHKPARSIVVARQLRKGVKIEMDSIALAR